MQAVNSMSPVPSPGAAELPATSMAEFAIRSRVPSFIRAIAAPFTPLLFIIWCQRSGCQEYRSNTCTNKHVPDPDKNSHY